MLPCFRGPYVAAIVIATFGLTIHAQTDPKAQSDRAAARIRALQAESDRLAAQARTVFGDLRKLELEREIKQAAVVTAERDLARVSVARDKAAAYVATLAAVRVAETPGVKQRLVALSKRGGAGYLQLLLAANDVRAMGRMARGVAAVAELDRVRLDTHRRTLAAERTALHELEQQRAAIAALQTEAARARAAVEAAVKARARLIDELDQRRDLAAQFVAELQQAQVQLERTIASADTASAVASLPIRAFQGDLAWPVDGKVASRFGRSSSGRFGTSIVRNGIELATSQGTTASAVHEGTVAFAGPFAGFGTLVIVDHGNSAFTLYGHLIEAAVSAGTSVSRGSSLGKVGLSPSGGAALYFELRIDGRPVDPLQWLARPNR